MFNVNFSFDTPTPNDGTNTSSINNSYPNTNSENSIARIRHTRAVFVHMDTKEYLSTQKQHNMPAVLNIVFSYGQPLRTAEKSVLDNQLNVMDNCDDLFDLDMKSVSSSVDLHDKCSLPIKCSAASTYRRRGDVFESEVPAAAVTFNSKQEMQLLQGNNFQPMRSKTASPVQKCSRAFPVDSLNPAFALVQRDTITNNEFTASAQSFNTTSPSSQLVPDPEEVSATILVRPDYGENHCLLQPASIEETNEVCARDAANTTSSSTNPLPSKAAGYLVHIIAKNKAKPGSGNRNNASSVSGGLASQSEEVNEVQVFSNDIHKHWMLVQQAKLYKLLLISYLDPGQFVTDSNNSSNKLYSEIAVHDLNISAYYSAYHSLEELCPNTFKRSLRTQKQQELLDQHSLLSCLLMPTLIASEGLLLVQSFAERGIYTIEECAAAYTIMKLNENKPSDTPTTFQFSPLQISLMHRAYTANQFFLGREFDFSRQNPLKISHSSISDTFERVEIQSHNQDQRCYIDVSAAVSPPSRRGKRTADGILARDAAALKVSRTIDATPIDTIIPDSPNDIPHTINAANIKPIDHLPQIYNPTNPANQPSSDPIFNDHINNNVDCNVTDQEIQTVSAQNDLPNSASNTPHPPSILFTALAVAQQRFEEAKSVRDTLLVMYEIDHSGLQRQQPLGQLAEASLAQWNSARATSYQNKLDGNQNSYPPPS